ncbi:MAG: pH regulation protein F [Lentisphaeria bacterium]|nr:pH regulation protein F [Lentisphaeria bacterium]
MNNFFIICGLVLFALVAIVLIRVLLGPTVMDRMVGANMIGTKTTVLLIFIGTLYEGRLDMFVDFALTYALLNFIGTITCTRYFSKVQASEAAEEEIKN